MWSSATFAARVAFGLAMVVGGLSVVWLVAELLEDPGGAAGVLIGAAIVAAVVGLSMLVVRRRHLSSTVLGIASGGLVVFAFLDAMLRILPRDVGPVVAISALVLMVPLAFLGLHEARRAGWLIVLVGMAPIVDTVGAALRSNGDGVHLGGSSRAVALLVLMVGVAFLLAADAGSRWPSGWRR